MQKERYQSACFTGHRNITKDEMQLLPERISEQIKELAERGITHYYAGGAVGLDLAAAVTVLNYKQIIPELTLTLAIPCRNHDIGWDRLDRELFSRVVDRADEVVYVSDEYFRGCMQKRNRYMVDRSCVCLYYMTRNSGGTYRTVNYAKKCGLEMIPLASGSQIKLFD